MMSEELVSTIDWALSEEAFRTQIQRMIAAAMAGGKVLALPVSPSVETMMLLLSQVHCDHCDAACCTSTPGGLLPLTPSEFKFLAERYGAHGMVPAEFGGAIRMPCRFLHKHRCSIYADRPLVCIAFPLQPGGAFGTSMGERREGLSLASSCPEGRRIAKAVYMVAWSMRQKVAAIGFEEAAEVLRKW